MRALTRRRTRAIAGKYRGIAWRRPGNTTPEDSTRKSVSVVDSCPALSIARTRPFSAPLATSLTTLVFLPTAPHAPPSILNSHPPMPEAAPHPLHALVTARPLPPPPRA